MAGHTLFSRSWIQSQTPWAQSTSQTCMFAQQDVFILENLPLGKFDLKS